MINAQQGYSMASKAIQLPGSDALRSPTRSSDERVLDIRRRPPIDQALLPASVRNGTPAAKQAYQTGLAFEQMLVDQLSQELAATASSSDGYATAQRRKRQLAAA